MIGGSGDFLEKAFTSEIALTILGLGEALQLILTILTTASYKDEAPDSLYHAAIAFTVIYWVFQVGAISSPICRCLDGRACCRHQGDVNEYNKGVRLSFLYKIFGNCALRGENDEPEQRQEYIKHATFVYLVVSDIPWWFITAASFDAIKPDWSVVFCFCVSSISLLIEFGGPILKACRRRGGGAAANPNPNAAVVRAGAGASAGGGGASPDVKSAEAAAVNGVNGVGGPNTNGLSPTQSQSHSAHSVSFDPVHSVHSVHTPREVVVVDVQPQPQPPGAVAITAFNGPPPYHQPTPPPHDIPR